MTLTQELTVFLPVIEVFKLLNNRTVIFTQLLVNKLLTKIEIFHKSSILL